MKCKYFILLMVLFFSLTYPVTSESQGENSGFQLEKTPRQSTRPSKDREIHETLETLRETHLIRELQLSEEKANAVIEKVPELKKLLDLREALKALKGPLGNVPNFRKRIQELVQDEGARARLLKELGIEE